MSTKPERDSLFTARRTPGGECPICGERLKPGDLLALNPDAFGDWTLWHIRATDPTKAINPITETPRMKSRCGVAGFQIGRVG